MADSLTDLIRRARQGDSQALGELIANHRESLLRLAHRELTGRPPASVDASDIVQQTCLSAVRRFPEFAGEEPAEFAAWLRTIQERNLIDAIRHATARKRATEDQVSLGECDVADQGRGLAPPQSPSDIAVRGENAERLLAAMERLPPDQRAAVQLRHLEGCSLVQIAARLGRTEVAAAASLIKRGLEALRRELKN